MSHKPILTKEIYQPLCVLLGIDPDRRIKSLVVTLDGYDSIVQLDIEEYATYPESGVELKDANEG